MAIDLDKAFHRPLQAPTEIDAARMSRHVLLDVQPVNLPRNGALLSVLWMLRHEMLLPLPWRRAISQRRGATRYSLAGSYEDLEP